MGPKATLHTFPSSEVSKMTYDNAGEQAALQAQQVPMWAEDGRSRKPVELSVRKGLDEYG